MSGAGAGSTQSQAEDRADHRDHQCQNGAEHPLERPHLGSQSVHLTRDLLAEALEAVLYLLAQVLHRPFESVDSGGVRRHGGRKVAQVATDFGDVLLELATDFGDVLLELATDFGDVLLEPLT